LQPESPSLFLYSFSMLITDLNSLLGLCNAVLYRRTNLING
jgi:hypothetical protein